MDDLKKNLSSSINVSRGFRKVDLVFNVEAAINNKVYVIFDDELDGK
ncbi:6122_t:CDS:1, partial [Entrophospora sp. SA101]